MEYPTSLVHFYIVNLLTIKNGQKLDIHTMTRPLWTYSIKYPNYCSFFTVVYKANNIFNKIEYILYVQEVVTHLI